jgi:hypothetical protein
MPPAAQSLLPIRTEIMNHSILKRLAFVPFAASALCVTLSTPAAFAQTASPVQSTARPFGLDIVAPVQAAGSDAASAAFDVDPLPSVRSLLNMTLTPGQAINDTHFALDSSKLQLATDSSVRVYFIGEGAGYHNTLGFNTSGVGIGSGDPKLIFPDASSKIDTGTTSWNGTRRSQSEPLLPGDFVNLGTFAGGTKLDFFTIADGANSPKGTFSTVASANPDHLNHVVAFTLKDSPYLIIGFEDLLNGGDRDFNDVLFAVDIGAVNAKALQTLAAAPEPATWLTLGSFLAVIVWMKRRQRSRAAASALRVA